MCMPQIPYKSFQHELDKKGHMHAVITNPAIAEDLKELTVTMNLAAVDHFLSRIMIAGYLEIQKASDEENLFIHSISKEIAVDINTAIPVDFLSKEIPYSGNVWQQESLANLVSRPCFAKL